MARLCTFVAIFALTIAMFFCLGSSGGEAFGAATEFGMMICGLGGFNYAFNRGAAAYQSVRISQAEQGIQPAQNPAVPSPVTINNGTTKEKEDDA